MHAVFIDLLHMTETKQTKELSNGVMMHVSCVEKRRKT